MAFKWHFTVVNTICNRVKVLTVYLTSRTQTPHSTLSLSFLMGDFIYLFFNVSCVTERSTKQRHAAKCQYVKDFPLI